MSHGIFALVLSILQVVFILEQLLLLPPLADTQAQYAAPGDWYLQVLFLLFDV